MESEGPVFLVYLFLDELQPGSVFLSFLQTLAGLAQSCTDRCTDPKTSPGFNIQELVAAMKPKVRFLHQTPSQANPDHGAEGTRRHHPPIALVQQDAFSRKDLPQRDPTGNWDQKPLKPKPASNLSFLSSGGCNGAEGDFCHADYSRKVPDWPTTVEKMENITLIPSWWQAVYFSLL